jgi:FKBP-type peptidyl-prolyl cis-trans isomerase FkpA
MIKNTIILSLAFVAAILLSGCKKDESVSWEQQFELDQKAIEKYLQDNNINAVKHQSGLFYKIIEDGDGPKPVGESKITVNYTANLLPSDVQLESNNNTEFFLNQLYYGWQIGIPLINEGGSIMLYLPRVYTDGKSMMWFRIDLLSVE